MLTINALQTPDAYGVHTTCWDREATVPRAYPGAPTSRLCPSVVAPSDRAGQEVPASVWTAAPGRRRVGGAPCQDRRRPTAPHSPSPEPRSQHWYFRMTGPRWPTRTCGHTHTRSPLQGRAPSSSGFRSLTCEGRGEHSHQAGLPGKGTSLRPERQACDPAPGTHRAHRQP